MISLFIEMHTGGERRAREGTTLMFKLPIEFKNSEPSLENILSTTIKLQL
jgi:hypothetical protein